MTGQLAVGPSVVEQVLCRQVSMDGGQEVLGRDSVSGLVEVDRDELVGDL